MSTSNELAVGIDIGGTNLKLGLITGRGQLVEFESQQLKRQADHSADMFSICDAVRTFIDKHGVRHQLSGVGAACPGILDTKLGVVKYAVNLGWNDLKLVETMEDSLQLGVSLVSDSVAGALGEQYYAAAGLSSYLYVCIGTGVGASLVTDNELFKGDSGEAINLGHISVIPHGRACLCGNKGCLESYVSATALRERALREMNDVSTMLKEYAALQGGLETRHIHEAALRNDAYALKLFEEAGEILGVALVNCIQLFGVRNIIIGGGMSQAGPLLLDPIRREVARRMGKRSESIRILNAEKPTQSGVLGAAARVFRYSRIV